MASGSRHSHQHLDLRAEGLAVELQRSSQRPLKNRYGVMVVPVMVSPRFLALSLRVTRGDSKSTCRWQTQTSPSASRLSSRSRTGSSIAVRHRESLRSLPRNG